MKYVMALDPGKTSGLSIFNRETSEYNGYELDFESTCATIAEWTTNVGEDLLVVCESFIITAHTAKNTQAPWSLELIGVARYFTRAYTGRDLVLQAPSAAKPFATDQRLKSMGWYLPGKGHANDSARHLLLVMATRGWVSQKQLAELVTPIK